MSIIRISALTLAAALLLAGCATQPRAYDPSASRALNIAKAAGLSEADDYPANKVPGAGIGGLLDITTSALSFESANGLDLAMGDAVGLGLMSFVFSPPAQIDRNALLAWIPEERAKDKDQAALVLSKLVLDAVETTLKAEGIAYHIDKAHQERQALFYPFLETSLDFELDGKNCGVSYHVYKTQTVGPKPAPPPSSVTVSLPTAFSPDMNFSTHRSMSAAWVAIPFIQSNWRERSARRYRRQCTYTCRRSAGRKADGRRRWCWTMARS